MIIRNHPVNLADTRIGLKPSPPPLLPCPAFDDGSGKHFWKLMNEGRRSEADRCWFCLQSRKASRDWPPVGLHEALRGN